MANVWGIHNNTLTIELVDGGFVSIGWGELGDLRRISNGRDGLKAALTAGLPDAKPQAVANWAGNLLRFRDEIQIDDVVVAPYRPDSTINIGIVTGEYDFDGSARVQPHRRSVAWKQLGLPRTIFTQAALYEIGSLLTVFAIRQHDAEFRAAMEAGTAEVEEVTRVVEAVAEQNTGEETSIEPRAERIARATRDFVIEQLHRGLTHREFEEFTADLLRALGYQARVTQFSQDGGIDVIAHRDPLGVEPPLLKVQCKHHTNTIGAPEIQQLVGAQGVGELSVFVTLGSYSREALGIERQRTGLRLLSGEDVVTLVLENYQQLPARWRTRMPLTPVLVIDDSADER